MSRGMSSETNPNPRWRTFPNEQLPYFPQMTQRFVVPQIRQSVKVQKTTWLFGRVCEQSDLPDDRLRHRNRVADRL